MHNDISPPVWLLLLTQVHAEALEDCTHPARNIPIFSRWHCDLVPLTIIITSSCRTCCQTAYWTLGLFICPVPSLIVTVHCCFFSLHTSIYFHPLRPSSLAVARKIRGTRGSSGPDHDGPLLQVHFQNGSWRPFAGTASSAISSVAVTSRGDSGSHCWVAVKLLILEQYEITSLTSFEPIGNIAASDDRRVSGMVILSLNSLQ